MSRNIATNVSDLNNDDYAVIDKDTGTVLGTNLALVRWDIVPEDTKNNVLSYSGDAMDYGEHNSIPLFTMDESEARRTIDQAEAWEAVASHPAFRNVMSSLEDKDTLSLVLGELDRLHRLAKDA